MITLNYVASFFLIALGLYTIVTKYNLVKTVIGLGIMDYGVNLLLISIGYNPGGTAPIFTQGELNAASYFVDPIPQALTLTSMKQPPGLWYRKITENPGEKNWKKIALFTQKCLTANISSDL